MISTTRRYTAFTLCFVTLLLRTEARSQDSHFEVVAVKINRSEQVRSKYPRLQNHTFNAENVSFRTLLAVAYGIPGIRINGAKWLDVDRFDVKAKTPIDIPDSDVMPLLQALLREFFSLDTHKEMRNVFVFEMSIAKSGLKLSVFDPKNPPSVRPNAGGSLLTGVGTMAQLADMLTLPVGRTVLDKTGIEGRFVYHLSYTPLGQSSDDLASTKSGPPDLFAAIQQQLGLKLESTKTDVEFVVVDHAERVPVAN